MTMQSRFSRYWALSVCLAVALFGRSAFALEPQAQEEQQQQQNNNNNNNNNEDLGGSTEMNNESTTTTTTADNNNNNNNNDYDDNKVTVELFYMPQCPGCRQMISTSFSEAFATQGFHDMADVIFVPFGRDHQDPDAFAERKQQKRVFDNVLESCALAIIGNEDQHTQLDYIECIDHQKQFTTDPSKIDRSCARVVGLSAEQTKELEECAVSEKGRMLAEANMQESDRRGVEYTPWIIVNGEASQEIEDSVWKSLFWHVCRVYAGPHKSQECPLESVYDATTTEEQEM